MDGFTIIDAVTAVTKKWAKQRKAEERRTSSLQRRRDALTRSAQSCIKEAASEVMPEAYRKASSDGKYPAHARQVMYAARGEIQRRTGKTLDDQYFCQRVLPDYIRENPTTTQGWDVVFDSRGHLWEPHTELEVPLGTIDVRQYLGSTRDVRRCSVSIPEFRYDTRGPKNRYGAILFIEKEGFIPLFRAVRLAERYDIAIMSTKGLSNTSSRELVDDLCSRHSIPLLVLHDFDKSGFSIVGTLRRDTRRYKFKSEIQVIDLGLRLDDVIAWGLEAEDVQYGKSDPTDNLLKNGATAAEIDFLCNVNNGSSFSGRRVELNAFASGDFVAWIESKLKEQGVRKVVPDGETLQAAYRQAIERNLIQTQLQDVANASRSQAAAIRMPDTLANDIRKRLDASPALPWDEMIAEQAALESQRIQQEESLGQKG